MLCTYLQGSTKIFFMLCTYVQGSNKFFFMLCTYVQGFTNFFLCFVLTYKTPLKVFSCVVQTYKAPTNFFSCFLLTYKTLPKKIGLCTKVQLGKHFFESQLAKGFKELFFKTKISILGIRAGKCVKSTGFYSRF